MHFPIFLAIFVAELSGRPFLLDFRTRLVYIGVLDLAFSPKLSIISQFFDCTLGRDVLSRVHTERITQHNMP